MYSWYNLHKAAKNILMMFLYSADVGATVRMAGARPVFGKYTEQTPYRVTPIYSSMRGNLCQEKLYAIRFAVTVLFLPLSHVAPATDKLHHFPICISAGSGITELIVPGIECRRG